MSKALFGAMAMFYAVGAGSGGGGGLTPPAALIGAYPQLNFSDIANTGGYLMNTAAAGTIVSDGGYYDAGLGGWVAKDAASVGLQMNGALGGFVLYANASLTPGGTFSPTPVIQYLGTGSPVSVTPIIEAQGGVYVDGGAAPAAAVDALAIYYAGAQANIVARTFPSGTYQAINVQTADFLIQTHSGAALSAWEFSGGGSVVQLHAAQSGVAEVFYDMQTADDGTALLRFKNGSATNGVFTPELYLLGSSTNIALKYEVEATTDTGSNPLEIHTYFKTGGGNITTRPLVKWTTTGADLLLLIPLSTGNNAALSWGSAAVSAPAFTTRAVGNRLVLRAAIDGTHVDDAVGVETGGAWVSLQQATSSFQFSVYAGTTRKFYVRGDGYTELVGTFRSVSSGAPSSGAGIEVDYVTGSTTGRVLAFDRTGAAYLNLSLMGSTVSLLPNGTAVLTATATAVTCTQPVGVPSFTVAGVPSAATAGQIIYVSNESGGAVLAFSDGTNWRRVTDRAIIT